MKKLKVMIGCLAIAIMGTMPSCSGPVNAQTETGSKTDKKCAKSCTAGDHAQSAELIFAADRVYDIAFISVKPGMESQLNEDYFPQALEIGKEYGARMMASFAVTEVLDGEIAPQMVGIFEWPDLATKERFYADQRYQKIKPLRDEALSFLQVGVFELDKNTAVTFRSDKSYEFFGAWLQPGKQEVLDQYFAVSGPIKEDYGHTAPVFKAMFKVADGALQGDKMYSPTMAGIVEWDKPEDFQALQNDARFKKEAAPLLNEALSRIDLIHTKFNFPEKDQTNS